MTPPNEKRLRLALPKGRMQQGVFALLADAGIDVRVGARGYRPTLALPDAEAKLLKPQNIVEMLAAGSRDLGFAGADWVAEKKLELVELCDTQLDPVRIVAAAPEELLVDGALPEIPLIVASEYVRLSQDWIERRGLDARFLRTYGATEVFPPEDADVILDNSATGQTLVANGLKVIEEVFLSSTRLYASPQAMEDPSKRRRIEEVVLVLQSVLAARQRVMVEVNVSKLDLDRIIERLPCMREPTISNLRGGAGFAVKAAVPRRELPELVPALKSAGGTDIVVSRLDQIVP